MFKWMQSHRFLLRKNVFGMSPIHFDFIKFKPICSDYLLYTNCRGDQRDEHDRNRVGGIIILVCNRAYGKQKVNVFNSVRVNPEKTEKII